MKRLDRPTKPKHFTRVHQTLIDDFVKNELHYVKPDRRTLPKDQITKNRISYTLTGQTFTEEHKTKISQALMGKKKSLKTRKRMSKAKRNMSDETKLKMSLAKRGPNHYMWGKKGLENPRFGKTFPKIATPDQTP